MSKVTYEKEITALLVIDPYNDFISEGDKIWDRLKGIAEANMPCNGSSVMKRSLWSLVWMRRALRRYPFARKNIQPIGVNHESSNSRKQVCGAL